MNFVPSSLPSVSVSVVIPVYNSGESAILSIESILSQTVSCTKLIVVDDGSTDGSAELLRVRFQDHADKIQIYSIENCGAAGARNFGISKCNSTWIAFLDSDDAWYSNKIEVQLRAIVNDPEIFLIGTLTTMQNFMAYTVKPREKLVTITLRTLLFKNYFQTSTVLVRRKALQELGSFPRDQRHAEEGDLFMRIAAKYKCVLVNEVLVDYAGGKNGFGTAGLSANLCKMEQGEIKNIFRTWQRGDSKSFIFGVALVFSFIKFLRRIFIKYKNSIFIKILKFQKTN